MLLGVSLSTVKDMKYTSLFVLKIVIVNLELLSDLYFLVVKGKVSPIFKLYKVSDLSSLVLSLLCSLVN